MRRNLVTSLRGRPRSNPMVQYDRLPPALRLWLAQAILPWSPHSAHRLWKRLHRETGGDAGQIFARLARAEQRLIAKDKVGRVQGPL